MLSAEQKTRPPATSVLPAAKSFIDLNEKDGTYFPSFLFAKVVFSIYKLYLKCYNALSAFFKKLFMVVSL